MACTEQNPDVRDRDHAPRAKVIDVLRAGLPGWLAAHTPTPGQAKLIASLRACRTAALGGHLFVCDVCGTQLPVYNPCRNRHCPNCQALEQERWIAARKAVLLPTGHHHVVFTLPRQLRQLARAHPREIYALLFAAAAATLTGLAAKTYAIRLGITAVLHTWTRDLLEHPHLHCIVTAGGLGISEHAWFARTRYLFPVRRMKARFWHHVVRGLERLHATNTAFANEDWRALRRRLPAARKWVVHLQPPFGRSTHVLEYLGRYTHRVAISDARLRTVDLRAGLVTFGTRGEATASLSLTAFTGRFLLHTLPSGFRKIRHFGLYSPASRTHLEAARTLLQTTGSADQPPAEPLQAPDQLDEPRAKPERACPHCGCVPMASFAFDPFSFRPRGIRDLAHLSELVAHLLPSRRHDVTAFTLPRPPPDAPSVLVA